MSTNETIVIEGKENTNNARHLSMYFALRLECLGMKNSRGSVYALVKKEFGLKGNKESVRSQFAKMLMDQGVLSKE